MFRLDGKVALVTGVDLKSPSSTGEHPKVVQERLGHSNISTTLNVYSQVIPSMQK